MENRQTKQFMVKEQATVNRNNSLETVALFDVNGNPITLWVTPTGEFTVSPSFIGSTELGGSFDILTDAEDPFGWIDTEEEELILPAGTYMMNVQSVGLFGGLITSAWAIVIRMGNDRIVLPSTYPSDSCLISDIRIVRFTEPKTISLSWSRNEDSSAGGGCTLTITKLA